MNITIVGTAYPLRGGIAHYNALLAEALRKRHTVDTITFKRQYPSFLFPGKTQQETGETSQVPPAPEIGDIAVHFLSDHRVGQGVAWLFQLRRPAHDDYIRVGVQA